MLACLYAPKNMASSSSSNEKQLFKPRPGQEVLLKTNDITDDYEILYETILGRGRNRVIYACKSKTSREMYAVKVLNDGKNTRKEVNLHWQACVSNCIVSIENVYKNVWDGKPSLLIVMEFMEGRDLCKRIKEAGRVPEGQAATIAKQIVAAVAHLHAMNVVHFDVKPDNFLFKRDSWDSPLKLTDFGLAKLMTPEYIPPKGKWSTKFYMYFPPEMIRGEKCDKSCDMWALGCTIYSLLSGHLPFNLYKGDDVAPGVQPSPHGEYTFPDRHWSHISEEAKDLIRGLLNIDPNERMSLEEMCAHPWMTGNGANHSTTSIAAADESSDCHVC